MDGSKVIGKLCQPGLSTAEAVCLQVNLLSAATRRCASLPLPCKLPFWTTPIWWGLSVPHVEMQNSVGLIFAKAFFSRQPCCFHFGKPTHANGEPAWCLIIWKDIPSMRNPAPSLIHGLGMSLENRHATSCILPVIWSPLFVCSAQVQFCLGAPAQASRALPICWRKGKTQLRYRYGKEKW